METSFSSYLLPFCIIIHKSQVIFTVLFYWFLQMEDEDFFGSLDDDNIDLKLSPWNSPLFIKLTVTFMFSQASVILFHECSGTYKLPTPWTDYIGTVWPQEILFGRLLQVLVINGFYAWRLYRAEDWTWNDWLAPVD